MKKLLAALTLAMASPAVLAIDATPLFSVYVGGGAWQGEYSGELGESQTDLDDLGFDDESNGYVFAAFEHVLPFIPQIRLERTSISSSGNGEFSGGDFFDLDDFEFSGSVETELELTFTDAVLYYEIAMFDFGVTLRQFDAEVKATGFVEGLGTQTEEDDVDGVLPMLYLQTKIDLPLTGFYVTGNVNTISYDDKSITDYRIAAGYEIEIPIIVDIGFEAGYRSFEVDLGDDEDDFDADIEVAGPYLGVNVKF